MVHLEKKSGGMNGSASNRSVVGVVYDGVDNLELAIASEIFGLKDCLGEDWYDFSICSLDPTPLRSNTGLCIYAKHGLEGLDRAGTILVFGWEPADEPVPDALLLSLRRAYARGARLVSLSGGTFVLAAAGLLDGRRATSHWRHAEVLARLYPQVLVDPSVLYLDEGQVLTSAGGAAAFDILIHMVRRDFGLTIANGLARRLVISPHRDGAQPQFVEKPVASLRDGRLASLLVKMRGSLEQDFTIAELASQAAMSERTFLRRFREMTGMAPSRWLRLARMQAAKEMLEDARLSIAEIAYRAGFGSAEMLRHHFRREFRLSPRAYRQRFSPKSTALANA